MKHVALLQAAAGLLLCALGYFLANRDAPMVHTVLATAGACNLPTDVYEPRSGNAVGSVVLLHGLASNKKVMSFTAQEFANQDLRVFVPDLPGHGKAPGPFSPARAETCAAALVRDLSKRKAIIPERTLLGGHSMGGAIAVRVAANFTVAGVIAISPAPMHPAPEVSPEILLFPTPPRLAPHSLVLSAAWEPAAIKQIAADLVTQSEESSGKYAVIARTTHISIIFAPATFQAIRSWSAQVLGTNSASPFPKSLPALGCLLGLIGLSLIVPPFLRETTLSKTAAALSDSQSAPPLAQTLPIAFLFAAATIALLRFFIPFRFVHIFQADYLASFLFIVALAVLILHRQALPALKSFATTGTAASVAAAFLLVLLFGAWFELTFYEAWLTPARWFRLPLLILLFLPWHLAEEILLGSPSAASRSRRFLHFFAIRTVLWLALLAGVLYFHSGQILFVLLIVYFVLFSILQRLASDVIRAQTRSAAAAAIFGAILLAGFALAIFPIA
jgi:pimeloyl-ACP methyl ester carboxylesterase